METYNCMAIHWVKSEEVSVTEPGRGGKGSDWTLNLALGVVTTGEIGEENQSKHRLQGTNAKAGE